MQSEILQGRWGGRWEKLHEKETKDGYHGVMVYYYIRSLRTGYCTKMRSDSFV